LIERAIKGQSKDNQRAIKGQSKDNQRTHCLEALRMPFDIQGISKCRAKMNRKICFECGHLE